MTDADPRNTLPATVPVRHSATTIGGKLILTHYPITEFAMGPGRNLPLPSTLQDIAETIGREAAVRLSEGLLRQRTGARSWRRQIYIPQRLADDHPTVLILGRALAEELQETHVNCILEIPRCAGIQAAYREHVARQMLEAGETPDELVESGVCTRPLAQRLGEEREA